MNMKVDIIESEEGPGYGAAVFYCKQKFFISLQQISVLLTLIYTRYKIQKKVI